MVVCFAVTVQFDSNTRWSGLQKEMKTIKLSFRFTLNLSYVNTT